MSRKDSFTKKQGSQPKSHQTKLVSTQVNRTAQMKPGPTAPPVYRPQPIPRVLQRKTAQSPPKTDNPQSNQSRPVAPPVYRPQPVPSVLQPRMAHKSSPSTVIQRAAWSALPADLKRKIWSYLNPIDGAKLNLFDKATHKALKREYLKKWLRQRELGDPAATLDVLTNILGDEADTLEELDDLRGRAGVAPPAPEPAGQLLPPPPPEQPPAPPPEIPRFKRQRDETNYD